MGPEGGINGGSVVYSGPPADIPTNTHTGNYLRSGKN